MEKDIEKTIIETYNIDYNLAYKNNFKADVQKAIKFYLDLDNVKIEAGSDDKENYCWPQGFILHPQALNPFLRIMETLGESKNIIILPASDPYDSYYSPVYMIIRVMGELKLVSKIVVEEL